MRKMMMFITMGCYDEGFIFKFACREFYYPPRISASGNYYPRYSNVYFFPDIFQNRQLGNCHKMQDLLVI